MDRSEYVASLRRIVAAVRKEAGSGYPVDGEDAYDRALGDVAYAISEEADRLDAGDAT